MRRDDVFPSKYLKCADLNGNPFVVTIEHAPLETFKSPEGKEQNKIVLYFRGAKKTLPLNLTNWDAVAEICGEDTEDWPGNRIELYPARTTMAGRAVDCIRIRRPTSQREAQPKAASKQSVIEELEELDDDFVVAHASTQSSRRRISPPGVEGRRCGRKREKQRWKTPDSKPRRAEALR